MTHSCVLEHSVVPKSLEKVKSFQELNFSVKRLRNLFKGTGEVDESNFIPFNEREESERGFHCTCTNDRGSGFVVQ